MKKQVSFVLFLIWFSITRLKKKPFQNMHFFKIKATP